MRETSDHALLVPIGGYGWGWGLVARFAFVVSFTSLLWALPLPIWVSRIQQRVLEIGIPTWAAAFENHGGLSAGLAVRNTLVPLLIAVIWLLLDRFIFDRSKKREAVVHEMGRVAARYGMAVTFASYGLEKVIGAQGTLWAWAPKYFLRPFGEMGGGTSLMVWLGYSGVYEQFAGWVELSAALLLPFRRFVTLGAVVSLMALCNVFVVNTGHWDWALSLTPVQMMWMPIVLVAPQLKRLWQNFSGQRVEPAVIAEFHPPRWVRRAGLVAKCIVVPWMFYEHNMITAAHDLVVKGPLDGIYTVEQFTRNGYAEPIAAAYPKRWREVSIENAQSSITVRTVGDRQTSYATMTMAEANTRDRYAVSNERNRQSALPEGDFTLSSGERGFFLDSGSIGTTNIIQGLPPNPGAVHFTRPSPGVLTLMGPVEGDTIFARLRRVQNDTLPFLEHRWYPTEWRKRLAAWSDRTGLEKLERWVHRD